MKAQNLDTCAAFSFTKPVLLSIPPLLQAVQVELVQMKHDDLNRCDDKEEDAAHRRIIGAVNYITFIKGLSGAQKLDLKR